MKYRLKKRYFLFLRLKALKNGKNECITTKIKGTIMHFNREQFLHDCTTHLRLDGVDERSATTAQLHTAVSKAVMAQISDRWTGICTPKTDEEKRCGYFSAD